MDNAQKHNNCAQTLLSTSLQIQFWEKGKAGEVQLLSLHLFKYDHEFLTLANLF
jgi:hypothetical protein